ncbi:MAG TPA: UDP-N-acetylmuramate--L-alanine ligase, partial [Anaerovoracaceae bacterium]|nr:UDP-N-acetylmuramate--L-alanine ligase [Anaerovoracaceae bacterium]
MAATYKKWIHMVGIAGVGMSGIARVLAEKGFRISGSDLQTNTVTQKLREMGIKIYQGHSSSNLGEGVDLLVISSAVPEDNPEIQAARKLAIPVIKRGEMLAELVNANKGIAVAGAHGKTTTTSMMCTVLAGCGLDPTFFIGGEFQGDKPGAKLGNGEYSIAEADESDASFLAINPYIAIVTNIEDDHMDYYKSFSNLENAFRQFLRQIKPGGFAIVYGDDPCIKKITQAPLGRIISYGEAKTNDYYLQNWQAKGIGSVFSVYYKGDHLAEIELSVPGKHNALNALTTIIAGLEIGLKIDQIKKALKEFRGTKRRFEIIGRIGSVTIVDDYAHHPSEIKATIAAAKNFHKQRLVVIFQPHRYSRTKLLGQQLGEAFK